MDLQEIDIFIDDNGEVKLEIRGVKGQKCLDLTQDLEAILGDEIISREMTPEAGEMVQEIKNQEFNWS
ncbi:DUF2997 domain-containing protein [Cyanobacterium aponinum UTEX 3222]|uniref:DUF2997 domain-containing protein n=1 Tax=Cyanobacterium aponinum TaxID=379064 RepID=UPI00308DBA54|nr:DUF2997 domain-containing protein [Cyanobacterium aponinum UTEX 3222]